MALISCPYCGKEISDRGKICPHCRTWLNQPSYSSATARTNTQTNNDYVVTFPKHYKTIGIILFIVLLLYLWVTVFPVNTNPLNMRFQEDVTCGWCGRVIRADGRNIHATPTNGGLSIKCDYCGFSNSIQER